MKKFWYIVRNFVLALFLLSLGSVGTFGVTALIYLVGLFLIISGIGTFFKSGWYVDDSGYVGYASFGTRLFVALIFIVPGGLIMKYGEQWFSSAPYIHIVSGAVYVVLGFFRLHIGIKENHVPVNGFGRVISFLYPLMIVLSGFLSIFNVEPTFQIVLLIVSSVFWMIRTVMVSRYIY